MAYAEGKLRVHSSFPGSLKQWDGNEIIYLFTKVERPCVNDYASQLKSRHCAKLYEARIQITTRTPSRCFIFSVDVIQNVRKIYCLKNTIYLKISRSLIPSVGLVVNNEGRFSQLPNSPLLFFSLSLSLSSIIHHEEEDIYIFCIFFQYFC